MWCLYELLMIHESINWGHQRRHTLSWVAYAGYMFWPFSGVQASMYVQIPLSKEHTDSHWVVHIIRLDSEDSPQLWSQMPIRCRVWLQALMYAWPGRKCRQCGFAVQSSTSAKTYLSVPEFSSESLHKVTARHWFALSRGVLTRQEP